MFQRRAAQRSVFGPLPLLLLTGALLTGCRDAPRIHVLDGATFGTRYQVQLVATDPDTAALGAEIERVLGEIDRSLSTWREDSEISAFNRRRDSAWVALSPPFAAVMAGAFSAWRDTGGTFDVTLRPLSLAWGFQGPRAPGPPAPEELAILQAHTGMDRLVLAPDGRALRKTDPTVEIDLSAIAKGYAVDRVGAVLDAAGHDDWLVEIGGEVRGRGARPDGAPWRIAVEPPPGPEALGAPTTLPELPVVALRDLAIATSGDYRNALLLEGRRLGHVLDPASGRPAAQGVTSATVLAASAMRADALATAFLVMPPEASLTLADRLGVGLLLVLRVEDPGGTGKAYRVAANGVFQAQTSGARTGARGG